MATLGATVITGLAAIESNSTTEPPAFNNSASVTEGTSCRAWVNFNGTGTFAPNPSTIAIRASFNVTSILKSGGGNFTVNITNALADGNYSAIANYTATNTGSGGNNDGQAVCWGHATGTLGVFVCAGDGTPRDPIHCSVAIFR
jgi:hypothetical protein